MGLRPFFVQQLQPVATAVNHVVTLDQQPLTEDLDKATICAPQLTDGQRIGGIAVTPQQSQDFVTAQPARDGGKPNRCAVVSIPIGRPRQK